MKTPEELVKEIKEKLREAFKDYKFFEKDHHYEYKGKKVGIGVTSFIHQFTDEFNEIEVAQKIAKKTGKSVESILKKWEIAAIKGTTCHEYAQSLWNEKKWEMLQVNDEEYHKKYVEAVEKIKFMAANFKMDHQDWIHLYDELPIGDPDYDIASCVDHLFCQILKNPDNLGYTIILLIGDYKTNTEMTGYNKTSYGKKMKPPLSHLDDDKLTAYKLQLSIYRNIIEKYVDLKSLGIDEIYTFIIYFTEKNNNYEIIQTPYLKNEVINMLEYYKWLN